VPDHGLGFGLLRFMNAEIGPSLAALPPPHLGFNYLGRLDASASKADWNLVSQTGVEADAAAAMPLAYPVIINALTLEGPHGPELVASWAWAPALIPGDAARELAESWFEVLEHLASYTASSKIAGGLTPSDLSLVSLSQAEIDRLERAHRESLQRTAAR
jgi:non-ribosomal peptide synthase protein (TIGR01720 family)